MYLTWNVPWAEGTISAEAYDENNRLIPEGSTEGNALVTTTGKAAKLKADADRKTITADGKDLSYIEVDVTDANSNIVPDAANRVTFDVKGAGKLVGVDNGSSPQHSPYQADNRKAFSGKVLAIVQSTKEAGEITVTAKADGLQSSTVKIATTAVPGTSTEKTVRSSYYSRNYYVKTGNKPILPSDVEVRYSDGTSDRQNVTVGRSRATTRSPRPVRFSVAGTVAGQKISVRVTMIDEIGALLNYSASTPVGTPAVLPGSRPAVLPDGTVTSANFAVDWTKPADTVYDTAGTVKVPGTATVFGKEFKVTATIRVQRSQVTIGSSVSGNALRLTQNIPADKQSDTLRRHQGRLHDRRRQYRRRREPVSVDQLGVLEGRPQHRRDHLRVRDRAAARPDCHVLLPRQQRGEVPRRRQDEDPDLRGRQELDGSRCHGDHRGPGVVRPSQAVHL